MYTFTKDTDYKLTGLTFVEYNGEYTGFAIQKKNGKVYIVRNGALSEKVEAANMKEAKNSITSECNVKRHWAQ